MSQLFKHMLSMEDQAYPIFIGLKSNLKALFERSSAPFDNPNIARVAILGNGDAIFYPFNSDMVKLWFRKEVISLNNNHTVIYTTCIPPHQRAHLILNVEKPLIIPKIEIGMIGIIPDIDYQKEPFKT